MSTLLFITSATIYDQYSFPNPHAPLEHVETQFRVQCLSSWDRHLLANEPAISSHCLFITACFKKNYIIVKMFAMYSHHVLYPVQNAQMIPCSPDD